MMNSPNPVDAGIPEIKLFTKICFLVWAMSITVLYWLAHGPYGRLIGNPLVQSGRDFMLRYFRARYTF